MRVVLVATAEVNSVTCMFTYPGGFVSGHKDGTVKLWSNAFEARASFDLATATPASMNTSVRSVCVNHDASVVLVGTQGCEIYELSLASKRFTQRVEGHYENEVRRTVRTCAAESVRACSRVHVRALLPGL